MKSTAGFIAFGVGVVLFLFILSSGSRPPLIPEDIFHSSVISVNACTACHTPGMQAPLKDTHPPKTECLLCHKAKRR